MNGVGQSAHVDVQGSDRVGKGRRSTGMGLSRGRDRPMSQVGMGNNHRPNRRRASVPAFGLGTAGAIQGGRGRTSENRSGLVNSRCKARYDARTQNLELHDRPDERPGRPQVDPHVGHRRAWRRQEAALALHGGADPCPPEPVWGPGQFHTTEGRPSSRPARGRRGPYRPAPDISAGLRRGAPHRGDVLRPAGRASITSRRRQP
jgi:hypothetical protein